MDVKEEGLIELMLITADQKDDQVAENVLMVAAKAERCEQQQIITAVADGWKVNL